MLVDYAAMQQNGTIHSKLDGPCWTPCLVCDVPWAFFHVHTGRVIPSSDAVTRASLTPPVIPQTD